MLAKASLVVLSSLDVNLIYLCFSYFTKCLRRILIQNKKGQ